MFQVLLSSVSNLTLFMKQKLNKTAFLCCFLNLTVCLFEFEHFSTTLLLWNLLKVKFALVILKIAGSNSESCSNCRPNNFVIKKVCYSMRKDVKRLLSYDTNYANDCIRSVPLHNIHLI